MIDSDTMIEAEAPKRPAFGVVKEAVKLRRSIKKWSHEEDRALEGSKGKRLNGILDHTNLVLSELQEEHRDWISQKHELFADYLSPIKPTAVDKAYKVGLGTTITQEFRTHGRVSKEETVKLDDPGYLKGVITGYTVDFFHSLRLSQRLRIHPNIALNIALLSYHYNPTKLTQLISQYPDINLNAVQTAALGYPTNPEAFLNGFIANVARLTEDPRFAGLNPSVINSAALGYPKDPEAFLKGFIANVARLAKDPRFAELAQSIIDRAALGYSNNPEAFLDGFIANVARLTEDPRFAGLNPSVINSAALGYPKDPEAFLKGFIANVAKLKVDDRYKGLTQSVIEYATLHNPKSPEGFLDGFIANVARLTVKYPGLKSTINTTALYFPGNPDAYIEKVKAGKVPEAEELE